eukprot:TRINITY_DN8687_c0_g1_i1.p1 TRINITY_DN8687_c0_g1~~TRINITY_DN8687_c0_g1_i1.p1  ORF type:complete len:341 (-),score=61.31 TRINITY_DN8687_c0_g1_i1:20-1042(-)
MKIVLFCALLCISALVLPSFAGIPTFFGIRSSAVVRECELFLIQMSFGNSDDTYSNYTIPGTDCSAAGNFSSALLWHTAGPRVFFTSTGNDIVQVNINSDSTFDSVVYNLPGGSKARRFFLANSDVSESKLIVQLDNSPLTVIIDPVAKTPIPSGQPSKIPEEVFAVRDGFGYAIVEGETNIAVRKFDLLNPANPTQDMPVKELPVVVRGSTKVFGGCAEPQNALIFHIAYFPDTNGTPNFTAAVVFDLASGEVTDAGPVLSLSVPEEPYTVLNPIWGTCATDGSAGYTTASLRDPKNIIVTSFVPQASGAREYLATRVPIQAMSMDATAKVLSLGLLAG